MLIDNPKGGFSFVKGIGPFSSGAVANAGFEIVHAVAIPVIKLDDGYEVIERHLRDAGRPMNAVCGMELRIPKPLTPAGFNEFNQRLPEAPRGVGRAGRRQQSDRAHQRRNRDRASRRAGAVRLLLHDAVFHSVAHFRAGRRGRSEIDARQRSGDRRGQ